jgi:type III restriction enzyme
MLKEGWDVTNLYTIVPLRAANARILIEQSIGRGLRLAYGKHIGLTDDAECSGVVTPHVIQ